MARLIDADALIKVFQHKLENNIFPLCVISTIEDAPTIEAEPVKRGKWVWLSDEDVMCTSCGSVQNTNDNCDAGDWDFCPKCGAKMGGE